MRALKFLFFGLFLLASGAVCGQKNLQAYFTYSTFYAPGKGPYIETYLSVNGESAEYAKENNGKYRAKIEITYIFKQGEEIKQFDKYELLGPEVADTNAAKVNFLDQQRIALPNGTYNMVIRIKDLNSESDAFSAEQPLKIKYPVDSLSISTIELVQRYGKTESPGPFTKSGLDVIPNITDYYPETKNEIQFYAEVYNATKAFNGDRYLIKYYIANSQSLIPLPDYIGYIRQNPGNVAIVLRKFNIERLKTGNYFLMLEVRDQQNELKSSQSIFFQRSNPKMDITELNVEQVDIANTFVEGYNNTDSLIDYVRSLRPIADLGEQKFIDRQTKKRMEHNPELLRRFLYTFWKTRDVLDPKMAWDSYQVRVNQVNHNFGTSIKRGYQTDRGRVYLKYGPPNIRTERPSEPNSYPYEIWQYDRIGNQSNGRFVFYDTDLITNDYELLHSTVFGELQNYRWRMMLEKRNTVQFNLDQEDPGGSVGNRALDFFENPR